MRKLKFFTASLDLKGLLFIAIGLLANSAKADELYREKRSYWVVSNHNCQITHSGVLFQCKFPEIDLVESSLRFPLVPQETKVTFNLTQACRGKIDAAPASIQVRLGQFTESEPSSDFLSNETVAFNQNQIVVLRHPQQYPLKRLQIAPRASEIFSHASFPPGCEVSLDIVFNRVAFLTEQEGEEHLGQMEAQISLLEELKDALLFLNTCQERQADLSEDFTRIKRGLDRNCKAQNKTWESLRGLAASIEAEFQRDGVLSANLSFQSVASDISAMSQVINQSKFQGAPSQAQLEAIISLTEDEARNFNFEARHLLEQERLQEVQTQLGLERFRLDETRRLLKVYFQDHGPSRILESFTDIAFDVISGPQGLTDQIKEDIRSIAPSVLRPSTRGLL